MAPVAKKKDSVPAALEDVNEVREELRMDIRELHAKTNKNAEKLATIDGRLLGTLPHLATKPDIERAMGKSLNQHVGQYHDQRKTPKQISMPPQPAKPIDPKVIAGLIGAVTILISVLSALLQKIIPTF